MRQTETADWLSLPWEEQLCEFEPVVTESECGFLCDGAGGHQVGLCLVHRAHVVLGAGLHRHTQLVCLVLANEGAHSRRCDEQFGGE
jgi:hypothetical protein